LVKGERNGTTQLMFASRQTPGKTEALPGQALAETFSKPSGMPGRLSTREAGGIEQKRLKQLLSDLGTQMPPLAHVQGNGCDHRVD